MQHMALSLAKDAVEDRLQGGRGRMAAPVARDLGASQPEADTT